MKEERLRILNMLEEGKITADEAAKLFESMHENMYFEDYVESDFNEKVRRFGKDTEEFLKNVGCKMNGFVKDMEPRVRNVTKTVVSKTAGMVDELSKALNDILDSMGNVCTGEQSGCSCDDCCPEDKSNGTPNENPDEENREN